jgi:hypothetical protein
MIAVPDDPDDLARQGTEGAVAVVVRTFSALTGPPVAG